MGDAGSLGEERWSNYRLLQFCPPQPPTLVHGPLLIKSKTDYPVNSGIYQ